jgi:hypothetical protein
MRAKPCRLALVVGLLIAGVAGCKSGKMGWPLAKKQTPGTAYASNGAPPSSSYPSLPSSTATPTTLNSTAGAAPTTAPYASYPDTPTSYGGPATYPTGAATASANGTMAPQSGYFPTAYSPTSTTPSQTPSAYNTTTSGPPNGGAGYGSPTATSPTYPPSATSSQPTRYVDAAGAAGGTSYPSSYQPTSYPPSG